MIKIFGLVIMTEKRFIQERTEWYHQGMNLTNCSND